MTEKGFTTERLVISYQLSSQETGGRRQEESVLISLKSRRGVSSSEAIL